jgi:hypothetical protein
MLQLRNVSWIGCVECPTMLHLSLKSMNSYRCSNLGIKIRVIILQSAGIDSIIEPLDNLQELQYLSSYRTVVSSTQRRPKHTKS